MVDVKQVLEYKCPCCGAGLVFSETVQKLTCNSCENTFDIEAVKQYNDAINQTDQSEFFWDECTFNNWSETDQERMRTFACPSCGGELTTDAHTTATFCPYCDNPAILPGRLSDGLRPDGVIPFKTTKDDAKQAFLNLCKCKPLLPKFFTQEQQIEKITGLYVPFWLYDCSCTDNGDFRATRVHSWMDAKYHYTRTDHYLLRRSVEAGFEGVPMDGSSKLDNAITESIEPFDFSQLVDFDMAYLSGFFSDKYDVDSSAGQERIRQRISTTMDSYLFQSCSGYTTVNPTARNLQVRHGKARYVLIPVWLLNTNYRGKTYTFAMNGQTGKMTGTFPISAKRSWTWFGGICGGVTLLISLLQWLIF